MQKTDKFPVTLKLSAEVQEWLKQQGGPQYRSAAEQAAFLCAQYLLRAYKNAMQARSNGAEG